MIVVSNGDNENLTVQGTVLENGGGSWSMQIQDFRYNSMGR